MKIIVGINFINKSGSNRISRFDTSTTHILSIIGAAVKGNLSDFFNGTYQKKTLFQRMFPLAAGVYAGLLFLSWLLFQGYFSLTKNTISDLGNPFLNPAGHWYFSAAFIYLALFMIPFYRFVHKRLAPLARIPARLGLLANLVGSGGFVALAIFPNTLETISIHLPAAVVSFGGLVVGGLIYWNIIVKDAIVKIGTRRIIPIAGALTNIVIGIAVFQLFDFATFAVKILPDSILAPWEWTMFFGIAANLLLLFRSVPEIVKKATIYRSVEEEEYCTPDDAMCVFANHLPDGDGCMDKAEEFCYERLRNTFGLPGERLVHERNVLVGTIRDDAIDAPAE